jgi:Flp pilus assembly protein TadG
MKSTKPFLRDERGAIAVIFGLLLPALLGFAALAIEVGYWYSEKDKLQIAADSAAYSALVAYSADKDLGKAIAVGVAQAQASGYSGSAQQITIHIPSPDGTLGPDSSRAVLQANTRLFLSALFLDAASIDIGVTAYATMDQVQANAPCMLALKPGQSRSILIAASVQVDMNCVVATNSASNDAIWVEGSAALTANCVRTPGTIGTNGGAKVTLNDCPNGTYPRETSEDSLASTPYWGSPSVPDVPVFADQHINQGRYGAGMPGGNVLKPGKYGKQVEIDGTVTLQPGIYYFSAGFRAAPGSKIIGAGVTIYVDQSKVLDIAQNVAWDLTAPTSGPTAGMVIMGNPANTGNSQVRLIGIIGNVQGGVYFPNQQLLTENGPNIATPRCTQIVASSIDIRGSGTIRNDCSAGSATGSKPGNVRLAKGPA